MFSRSDFDESGGGEVAVECQGLRYSLPSHDFEADRIHIGVGPLVVSAQPFPGSLVDVGIHRGSGNTA